MEFFGSNDFNRDRFILGVGGGALSFLMFFFFITFIMGHLAVSPSGKFMVTYIDDKSIAETQKLIDKDPEKFLSMKADAKRFDLLFTIPWSGFMMGVAAGVIAGGLGGVAATMSALIISLVLFSTGYVGSEDNPNLVLLILIAFATIGGIIGQFGSPKVGKAIKEHNEKDDARRAKIKKDADDRDKAKALKENEDAEIKKESK